MDNLYSNHSKVSKLIVLWLIISMLAGCATNRPRGCDGNCPGGGLSTPEQVGIGIGAALGAALLGYLLDKALSEDGINPEDPQWNTNGPIIPEHFNFSDLKIGGYVQGGWPVAIDFQLDYPLGSHHYLIPWSSSEIIVRRPGSIYVVIKTTNNEPYIYPIPSDSDKRKVLIFKLPKSFGNTPVRAIFEIHAKSNANGIEMLVPIKIFGIACGSKAVGSIGIDQINFGPGSIKARLGEKAYHSFFAHKSFNKVQEEFRKIENSNGTISVGGIAYKNVYDPFRSIDETSGQWIGKDDPAFTWDGKTEQKRPSIGIHQLQVRAWYTNNDKDWVVAFSPGQVEVKE
jgi:hypothetical protein